MTFAPPTASGIATRRLGLANGLLWIVAAIVLVVVGATSAYAFVVNPYTPGGGLYNPNNGSPWLDREPLEAEEVAEHEWAAEESAVIRIPARDIAVPLRAQLVRGDEVDLYRTEPDHLDADPADRPAPRFFEFLYDDREILIVPTGDDLELWVRAAGPWQLRLAPVDDLVTIDDDYDGRGDAVILYTGDAVSGRFTHLGGGVFFVRVYTAYERNTGAIIESGEVNRRISWQPGSWVVFEIESDADRGAWSIDIEQLAPTTPRPTETDG